MKDIFDDLPLSPENGMPRQHGLGHDDHDSYLSMGEYEELRLMLASAKAAFAQEDEDILPDPRIKANIRAMVAARKKGFELPTIQINWQRILNHPLPAYQFGLAMVLVLFLAFLVGRNMGFTNANKTIVVYKTDTVFQNAPKTIPPSGYLVDSQAKFVSPAYSGSYFADSIDYNIDDNSSATPSSSTSSPLGIKHDTRLKQHTPTEQKISRPADMDNPVKGGSYLDDTSKWNRNLHGLL